jgi:hypothetical protein
MAGAPVIFGSGVPAVVGTYRSRGCECSTGEYVPGLWREAAAFVDERDRILLLLAPFAFEIRRSTLWITLVEPPMHADLA